MNVFTFNNQLNRVEINEPELLLIKEFSLLFGLERNKTKDDPTGVKKTKAFREFTYIWLMLDWKSPYSDFPEQVRHKEVLADSGLTQEEFDDPLFRAACRKYRELQESSITVKMFQAAQNTVIKFIDYFNSIDPQERDPVTGKPIFKVKDIMQEVKGLAEVNDNLKALELQVKKEQSGDGDDVLGDVRSGTFDD